MSRFLTSSSSLVALLLLSLAACTSDASSDAEDSESDLHIKPKDGETLARLTVATPGGWALPVNPSDDGQAQYRSAAVPFNVAQRLKEGDGQINFYSKFDGWVNAGNVPLVKGKATTYTLGSIKPTYTAASDPSSTLRRDFGPTPALQVFYTGAGLQETRILNLVPNHQWAAFWNGNPSRPLLAAPGDYRFSWSLPILDDVKKTLGDGEQAAINLAPVDKRATIIIKKPASRDLPDAAVPQCHLATRTFLVHRRVDNSNGQYGEPASYDQRNTGLNNAIQDGYNNYSNAYDQATSWAALTMKDDTTVKVFPFAASEGAAHYELVVNNVAMPLSLKPGDTKTIQLERLDVDDVEVTKENGDTYMQRGTWQLFRQGPNGSWLPITMRQDCSNGAGQQVSFSTNSGVDVLPGTYRMIISYSTAEGPKTQDQVVTVP